MQKEMTLGRFIAGRRKYLGMTQADLAKKINVSKSAIAKWETDGGVPDRDNLRSLAEAINTSVDDMHRIMKPPGLNDAEIKVNITSDIIEVLESYGYTVIGPGESKCIDSKKI